MKEYPLTTIPRIWKVSHSLSVFEKEQRNWLTQNSILAVHKDTGNGSSACFKTMGTGDIVSLCHGNTVFRLARILSDIEHVPGSSINDDWLMRKYDVIKSLAKPVDYIYEGGFEQWSPRYPGSSREVPEDEYQVFEQKILKPYYDLTLEDLSRS